MTYYAILCLAVRRHMERYRSGHNGADSKSVMQNVSPLLENPLFIRVFRRFEYNKILEFSPSVLPIFQGVF